MALVAGAAVLLVASEATQHYWLAEDGPIEQLAVWLWLIAASLAMWRARGRWIGASWALVFLLMAVRETGLPKAVIPSGRRLLRLSYYLDPSTPLWQRVVIGLLLCAILLALIHVGWRGVREGLMRHGWRQGAGQFVTAAVCVVAASQLFEAMPGWLGLDGAIYTLCWALEESLETLVPALMLCAIIHAPASGGLFGRRAA